MAPSKPDPQLPHDREAELYLLQCCVAWPDRAESFMHLVRSTDFVDELHQNLWRTFHRQFSLTGEIDPLEAAKQHDCVWFVIELQQDSSSAALADIHAAKMKSAAKARQVYDIAQRAADAILRGRSADSVLASMRVAMAAFEEPAVE
jgi:replicative DNA helicase